jgi:EAL domain-containing protein (putative c-di-GMP-specific phosphodiesterase class I)
MGIQERRITSWSDPHERLRAALVKDELSLFCQPIHSLSDAAGYPMAEALVRMREEETALLPPGDFLPVFEHYGMMPQLDRWVLQRLIEQLTGGCQVPQLSMNVSVQTLADADFPKFFADRVVEASIRASSVLFEVEESDLFSHQEAGARFLSGIKAAGGGIVIDGFGRESISYAPLESSRPDYLKVDGAIIRKFLKDAPSEAKLESILRIADSFHIGVIADCVEEPEALARLKALGVGYAQGCGLSLPRPIEQFSHGDSTVSAAQWLAAISGEPAFVAVVA